MVLCSTGDINAKILKASTHAKNILLVAIAQVVN